MSFEFKFPDVGEGLTEGEVVQWKVKVGDLVQGHQAMLEVETDKAVVEIPSPETGFILSLKGGPGDIIKVGEVIAVIGSEKELKAAQASAPPAAKPVPQAPPPPQPAAPPPEPYTVQAPSVGVVGSLEEAPEDGPPAPEPKAPPPVTRPRVEALPKDRDLAKRLGVDIELIHGTGPKGRVSEEDVRRAAEFGAPEKGAHVSAGVKAEDGFGPVERVPLRGLRRRISQAMTESLAKTAQVATMDEADVDELWRIRQKMKAEAQAQGVRLTLLPFLVKAVVGALKRVPELNTALDEAKGEIVFKAYYHIGVAVDTQDGLIVPNIKDADRKSVLQIARELEDLAQKARRRTLEVRDLKGGSFTITNYGSIGGLFGTPIINYPEAGILGVGRMVEKPVAEQGAIRIKKVLPLSLTFDHRLV
ncbi:MAG: dihydrolipoamide acetyltransferase family protein, partial [Elusimicrobia bacterium]|nr:dihydrolipoamide acetyltransferase family protein [Elusimicrobiota bacterium]